MLLSGPLGRAIAAEQCDVVYMRNAWRCKVPPDAERSSSAAKFVASMAELVLHSGNLQQHRCVHPACDRQLLRVAAQAPVSSFRQASLLALLGSRQGPMH